MRRREPTEKNFFEGNVKLSRLATSMNNVFKTIQEAGLAEGVEESLEKDIRVISDSFGISPKAAILLPYIVEHNMTNGSDADDLAGFVGCSNIEFFGFRPQLEEMEKRGVIGANNQRCGRIRYFLSREALKAIEKDDKFTPFPMKGLTADELFTRFRIFFSDFQNELSRFGNLVKIQNPDFFSGSITLQFPSCRTTKNHGTIRFSDHREFRCPFPSVNSAFGIPGTIPYFVQ